jgi:hypothetical protein
MSMKPELDFSSRFLSAEQLMMADIAPFLAAHVTLDTEK